MLKNYHLLHWTESLQNLDCDFHFFTLRSFIEYYLVLVCTRHNLGRWAINYVVCSSKIYVPAATFTAYRQNRRVIKL